MKEKRTATFKLNGGAGALLCSYCSKIIKIGKDFTEEEREAAYGDGYLEPQYCGVECESEEKKELVKERLKSL